MANEKLPKWVDEIPNVDEMYLDFWISTALVRMQEYSKKSEVYASQYGIAFKDFESHVLSSGKENLTEWDDYVIWKGIEDARILWSNRYEEIRRCTV